MSLTPLQSAVGAAEILLLVAGAILLARQARAAGPVTGRLQFWPVSGFEVALLIALIFLLGTVSQGVLVQLCGARIKAAPDRAGLELAVYGLGFHGGALLAWPVFRAVRRRLYADYHAEPPPETPARPAASVGTVLRQAGAALLAALPVVSLVSFGWTQVLRALGLPEDPQDAIAIFTGTRSPAVLAGMLAVACVVAPVNEELLFRRGLFHALRQKFGRVPAVLASAACFGAVHLNWAGFLPLAALGAVLALAYERTGDIRVPIVAHALFNLNTIVLVFADLPGTT